MTAARACGPRRAPALPRRRAPAPRPLDVDTLAGDPEGGLLLEPEDVHALLADLLARLPASAEGRVACVLEGGYALDRIGAGYVAALHALAELPPARAAATS